MKVYYTSSGDTSLLSGVWKRSLPSGSLAAECAEYLEEVREGRLRARARLLDRNDLKARVASCEPARFMLLRELAGYMKRSMPVLNLKKNDPSDKNTACIRFCKHTTESELLALEISAICCGYGDIILSCDEDCFEDRHALSARLAGAREVWLCSERECAARAAFSHKCALLTGFGSEEFCLLAGLVTPFIKTAVAVHADGVALTVLENADIERVKADVALELSRNRSRHILLISKRADELKKAFSETDDERVTLLCTSSDTESAATAGRFYTFLHRSYGGESGGGICADELPPMMQEALMPTLSFGIPLFSNTAEGISLPEKIPSAVEFAEAIAKYAQRGLTQEEKASIGVRFGGG